MGYIPARIDKVFAKISKPFRLESRLNSAGDLRDHLLLHLQTSLLSFLLIKPKTIEKLIKH
jgi:hypothetical protein